MLLAADILHTDIAVSSNLTTAITINNYKSMFMKMLNRITRRIFKYDETVKDLNTHINELTIENEILKHEYKKLAESTKELLNKSKEFEFLSKARSTGYIK